VKEKIKIALDCMGGDNSPKTVIEGANIIASQNKNVYFLLYGKSDEIELELKNCSKLKDRYTIIHTDQVISSDEKPSLALRRGTKSSMRLAINAVKEGQADVAVSAGNTGALMAISKIVLRSLPSIDRPAIVTSIPNQKNSGTVLLDMGANVECDSDVLFQFAIMGHAFAKTALNIKNPKIGILNIGSEDLKGNDAVRNAALLLKESDLKDNFYGYVEGNDITKGTVDVVVTDGFTGNISLKVIEGTAKMVNNILREAFTSSIMSKIGYLLARCAIAKSSKKMDPRLHNGAMLIGLNGVVVKSHGGADSIGFANAISVAISLIKDNINEKISNEIKGSDG
jgi:glycerol-3-phosphate acyltransferase PlsX